MSLLSYLRLWLASVRYSLARTMMFRFDFLLWLAVDTMWMVVNLLLIVVIYRYITSLAGWGKYEMLLLVGTSMIIARLFTGLFMSNLFEIGRNVRSGAFDFFLAQPGQPLFMVSTRKIDLDGILNAFLGAAVVVYSAVKLHLPFDAWNVAAYVLMLLCGLAIHYATVVIIISLTFWIVKTEGIEGGYFTLYEFSRLPRAAFRGPASLLFVYLLPAVVVSNVPANALLHGPQLGHALWLLGATVAWFALALFIFNRGLKRYSSASS